MKFKDLQVGQQLIVYVKSSVYLYEVQNAIVEEISPVKISFRYLDEKGNKTNGITLISHSKHFWDLAESPDGVLRLEAPQGEIYTETRIFIKSKNY